MTLVLVIAYWQAALCRYTMDWDMTNQAFVWHRYISECFHSGIIPLWAPYSKLGYPFYADPQSGLFYPVVWLLAVVGHYSLYSNNFEFFIHIVLAAWGMRYLLQTLHVSKGAAAVFALVYAMSGPATGHASHSTLTASLCWLPWLLASYIRMIEHQRLRDVLLTALFLVLQLTGGYAGITIILIYVMAGLFIYYMLVRDGRSSPGAVAKAHVWLVIVVLLVSVSYLYAVAQGQPYIDRGEGVTRITAGNVPFSPRCLITIFYPQLVGAQEMAFGTDITMQSLYIGILPLVLIATLLLGRQRRSAYVIALASGILLLAAMGDHTPLRGWLYDYLPLMKLFRHAGIFRLFVCIGWIILAARGFDALDGLHGYKARAIYRLLIVVMLLLATALWIASHYILRSQSTIQVIAAHSLPIVLYALAALLIIAVPGLKAEYRRALLALLTVVDMGIGVQWAMHKTIVSECRISQMQQNVNSYPSGFPLPSNVPITSYNQWNDAKIAPPIWQNAGFIRKQLSFEGNNSFNLRNYNLIYAREDFYAKYSKQNLISADSNTEIQITGFGPDRIGFTVRGDHHQEVRLGQVYFPGWSATVDGSAVAVTESADHFIACHIADGQHQVVMSFAPAGARYAFIFGVFSFFVLITAVCITAWRRPS